uniref:Putative secreted protein n=1 Tax=Ixodes ricinus TaxID=34613 RepID=A0A6B0U0X3_IXORI
MSLEPRMVSLAAICFILLRWSITGRYFSSLVLLAWTRASFRFSKGMQTSTTTASSPRTSTRLWKHCFAACPSRRNNTKPGVSKTRNYIY